MQPIILKCSKCRKPVASIIAHSPNQIDPRTNKPFHWKFVADCCYCDGRSYITEVKGGISIGGYGEGIDVMTAEEKTVVSHTEEMKGNPDVTCIKTRRCARATVS